MIELSPLARPYAKAVFSAALDAGTQIEVAEQLELLSAVSQINEVSSLIEDPELSKEKIARTIINITEGEIGELAKKKCLNSLQKIRDLI
jgi:F-type H+-transporting ATPase subunit delta